MLVEAQLSGVPALQQKVKAPNTDKGSQCVALPGHAVTQALPHLAGCSLYSPFGKSGEKELHKDTNHKEAKI